MRFLTTALLVALAAGCSDRGRPAPLSLDSHSLALTVAVLDPLTIDSRIIATGDSIRVRVRATEPTGQLAGIGFVARRSGAAAARVDSAAVALGPASDVIREFTLRVPVSLPPNTQLDIYGIAFGPGGSTALSFPQAVLVFPCTPGATWC